MERGKRQLYHFDESSRAKEQGNKMKKKNEGDAWKHSQLVPDNRSRDAYRQLLIFTLILSRTPNRPTSTLLARLD